MSRQDATTFRRLRAGFRCEGEASGQRAALSLRRWAHCALLPRRWPLWLASYNLTHIRDVENICVYAPEDFLSMDRYPCHPQVLAGQGEKVESSGTPRPCVSRERITLNHCVPPAPSRILGRYRAMERTLSTLFVPWRGAS